MLNRLPILALILVVFAPPLAAQQVGTASGLGTITRYLPSVVPNEYPTEEVSFSPKYSFAYSQGSGESKSTFIVFTEKEPPIKAWLAAKDRNEARRLWCEKEKASFVAVELNPEWGVELLYLCPANGNVNTEMVSSANGLASVEMTFEKRDATRLQGKLRGGEGNCGEENGVMIYCTPQEKYEFDAPLLR